MSTHDPLKVATTLSAKLAARSRHVCVFLGAGASRACGLPDVALLQSQVLTGLGAEERSLFELQLKSRNLEQALSRLRRIRALLTEDQSLEGLTAESANSLDAKVCQEIIKRLDVTTADLLPAKRFAAWVARAHYHLPVEIFTVNYDLLLETALEELRIRFFDGFVGVLRAQFQIELVEASPDIGRDWLPAEFVRLWKLHGSVNWRWEDQTVVRLGQPVSEEAVAAIYPSDTKYEESRRVPFVVLQDRFRRALHSPETILLVSGYAFGDDHLNEMIFDAAARRERSEIVAFMFGDIPEDLSKRALATPNLQVIGKKEAILSAVRRAWKAPQDDPAGLWVNNEFTLPDFKHLSLYLARSAAHESGDAMIKQLLYTASSELVPIKDPANG